MDLKRMLERIWSVGATEADITTINETLSTKTNDTDLQVEIDLIDARIEASKRIRFADTFTTDSTGIKAITLPQANLYCWCVPVGMGADYRYGVAYNADRSVATVTWKKTKSTIDISLGALLGIALTDPPGAVTFDIFGSIRIAAPP